MGLAGIVVAGLVAVGGIRLFSSDQRFCLPRIGIRLSKRKGATWITPHYQAPRSAPRKDAPSRADLVRGLHFRVGSMEIRGFGSDPVPLFGRKSG